MEDAQKIAYSEVGQILDFLGEEYKKKIPNKIIKLFDNSKDLSNNLNIAENSKIEELNLNRNTFIILSILNLKYWETDPDKIEKLKNIYGENNKIFQENINKYKEKDWLQNINSNKISEIKEKTEIAENKEVTCLVVQKEDSIITKIKNFLLKIFHKRK